MAEVEIRFAVPHDLDARVARLYAASPARTVEHNETTYFDTPDLALWRRGIECRIRQGDAGLRQTVKAPVPGGAAFARAESELRLTDNQLNFGHLRTAIPAAADLDLGALRPVFRAHVERQRRLIERNGAEIEAAYDQGTLVSDRQSLAIDDVEHELKHGGHDGLANSCLDFLDEAPCGLQTQSKAARGFRLVTGDAPVVALAEPLHLPPDTAIPDAIRAMLRSAFAQVLRNHAPLIETSDPEAVHQMRVGIRRLRAVLSAFSPVLFLGAAEDLLSETKAVFAQLGDVRDADVFLLETLPRMPDGEQDEGARRTLQREVERFRRRTRAASVAYFTGADFARLAVRWQGWIESGRWLRDDRLVDRLLKTRPVHEFASARLARMTRKLLRHGHRARSGAIDDWHRVRIAAKKLRYAGDPLKALLDDSEKRGRTRIRKLAALQDDLGVFNDMCNVAPFLQRVRGGVPQGARPAFAEATAFCAGWSEAEAAHAVAHLEKTWKKFEAANKAKKS